MKTNKGFTLIELMITIIVFGIIITAVYATHIAQQNTYQVQDQVAEMQQNLRAALYFMTSEIRVVGYDPSENAGAGITIALTGRLQFTVDLDEDGVNDPNEVIDIGFSPTIDAAGDGIPDSISAGVPDAARIGKQEYGTTGAAGGYQAFAENIQAVEFLYLDSAGAATTVLNNIRSVQVTLLARASRPDQNFTNTRTYYTRTAPTPNWGPYNDNFRRRMVTTTIRCRNLGI